MLCLRPVALLLRPGCVLGVLGDAADSTFGRDEDQCRVTKAAWAGRGMGGSQFTSVCDLT